MKYDRVHAHEGEKRHLGPIERIMVIKLGFRSEQRISLTWKGQPLWDYEAVINLIGATRTNSGLRVKAVLDTNEYETGVSISDEQMEELRIRRHKTHPAWNYTLTPRSS